MEAFEILFPILSLPPNSPKFSKGLRYVHTLSPRVGISLRRVCQTNLERTNSLNFGLEEDHKEVGAEKYNRRIAQVPQSFSKMEKHSSQLDFPNRSAMRCQKNECGVAVRFQCSCEYIHM